MSGYRDGARDWVRMLAGVLGVTLALRVVAFEPFNIPSGSMIPTLLVGDYLFVNKSAYGWSWYSLPSFLTPRALTGAQTEDCEDVPGRLFGSLPQRGDVAVFKLPSDPRIDYIKRIVGLPCDRVQVIDGVLHLNGAPVPRERLPDYSASRLHSFVFTVPSYRETLPDGRKYTTLQESGDQGSYDNTPVFFVPPGHVFAMGDNRDRSEDSRNEEMVGFIPVENLVGRASYFFLSLEEGAGFWQVWRWPTAVRTERLFTPIQTAGAR